MKPNLQKTVKYHSFFFKSMLMTVFVFVWATGAQAQEVQWKKNFGGSNNDYYYSVVAVSDGFVAVGHAEFYSGSTGDWEGVIGKGLSDAIIVKYDNDGNVVWKRNFGGSASDTFEAVTAGDDGYVAVGRSLGSSFGNGDWEGEEILPNTPNVIIVKFNNDGEVVWKKHMGGGQHTSSQYYSVTAVTDGYVATGTVSGIGTGDWEDLTQKGTSFNAVAVKYDLDGNVMWKKNFGGYNENSFYSVITVTDGFVAVGYSWLDGHHNPGDWAFTTGNGWVDAAIVKYDFNGNVVWRRNFGGINEDIFYSVTEVSDGFVAVGHSNSYSPYHVSNSFGTGDWVDVTGRGGCDAIIVKYDREGNVVWKKHFGGSSADRFETVTTVSDGVVAAGWSNDNSPIIDSFGTGDWEGVAGKGGEDAIIVKYDNEGNIVWKKHFGDIGTDRYHSITAVSDDIVAVGASSVVHNQNNPTGDWAGIARKGNIDAFIVKYTSGNNTNINETALYNFNIYPNPVKDELRIENEETAFGISQLRIKKVEILDVTGKKQFSTFNSQLSTINVSALSQGIYFVKIETDKGIVSRKLIKE